MDDIQLGTRVTFSHFLTRRQVVRSDRSQPYRKAWERVSVSALARRRTERLQGVIVGIRTASDGFVEYGDESEPTQYTAEQTYPVYLVAWHLRKRVVKVRLQDCTPELATAPQS